MIIDTHCHYNLEPIYENWKLGWQEAKKHDVIKGIVVGTDIDSSRMAQEIIESEPSLFATVGIHPSNFLKVNLSHSPDQLEDDTRSDGERLSLTLTKKTVAIGETGLDYFRLPANIDHRKVIKHLQKKSFISQIHLAKENGLPLIVHVRDREITDSPTEGNAYWDALKILQDNNVTNFVLHCASGPLQYIKAAVEMGGYMGFDGNITYPNADAIRNIFKAVPADRRVVETDAPYLPPQEYRGQVCEPWMIEKTVEYIEKEFSVERQSFVENAERLFKI